MRRQVAMRLAFEALGARQAAAWHTTVAIPLALTGGRAGRGFTARRAATQVVTEVAVGALVVPRAASLADAGVVAELASGAGGVRGAGGFGRTLAGRGHAGRLAPADVLAGVTGGRGRRRWADRRSRASSAAGPQRRRAGRGHWGAHRRWPSRRSDHRASPGVCTRRRTRRSIRPPGTEGRFGRSCRRAHRHRGRCRPSRRRTDGRHRSSAGARRIPRAVGTPRGRRIRSRCDTRAGRRPRRCRSARLRDSRGWWRSRARRCPLPRRRSGRRRRVRRRRVRRRCSPRRLPPRDRRPSRTRRPPPDEHPSVRARRSAGVRMIAARLN
jgi:hypothetical protein